MARETSNDVAAHATTSPAAATVLLNAAAGVRTQVTLKRLQELFAEQGSAVEVVSLDRGDDLCAAAKEAVHRGCRTLVAAGGDGTINAVASVIVGTEAVLGVLPLGTLNHFAKDLGIPLPIEQAVATVVGGRAIHVDVGEVNGKTFLNNSSIGLYPALVHHREAQQRLGRRKWSAFMHAILTALGRHPLIRVTVDADGQRITRRTPLVFVGNNDYHIHGLKLGTRDRLDGGLLSIYVTRDVGRGKLVWFACRVLFGLLRDTVDFDALQAEQVTIFTGRDRLRVATDGETNLIETPLEYRVRPRALRVLVPIPVEKSA